MHKSLYVQNFYVQKLLLWLYKSFFIDCFDVNEVQIECGEVCKSTEDVSAKMVQVAVGQGQMLKLLKA